MKNILVNAYAVAPNWGSEQGMGWNWIINLANHCNVFVITEGEWQSEIEEAVNKLPQKGNLHFFYNPLPDKVRKMCWNQGDWRFYYYYKKWQKRTLKIAEEIIAKHKIDVIHQLNMIGFREPGYLWRIKNIPFVWGPIGGMGNIPVAYLKGAGWKQHLFCRLKNTISDLQAKYSPRVRKAIKRGVTIAATKEVKDKVKKIYKKDIPLINETGCYPSENSVETKIKDKNELFKILWVGKFDFRKQLDLALKTISDVRDLNLSLTICGEGNPKQMKYYHELVESLKISDKIIWKGKVNHDEINILFKESDLFLFTSISDATSTVVIEAIENNLPVLSFNTCGFGPLVDDFAGIVIPLSNPNQSINDFSNTIRYIYNNPEVLKEFSKNISLKRETLYWYNKINEIISLYSFNRELN